MCSMPSSAVVASSKSEMHAASKSLASKICKHTVPGVTQHQKCAEAQGQGEGAGTGARIAGTNGEKPSMTGRVKIAVARSMRSSVGLLLELAGHVLGPLGRTPLGRTPA